jgi:hypothetical protein
MGHKLRGSPAVDIAIPVSALSVYTDKRGGNMAEANLAA